jgi:hypothetical protein
MIQNCGILGIIGTNGTNGTNETNETNETIGTIGTIGTGGVFQSLNYVLKIHQQNDLFHESIHQPIL